MSLALVRASANVELDDNLHLGRILVLLNAVDRGKGKTVEGITKLAKLDFLLRYPNCLERALVAVQRRPELACVDAHERTTIEAKMVRFKYGPWDSRYRRWIGLLMARRLAETYVSGKTVHVTITQSGCGVALGLSQHEEYERLQARAKIVAQVFGTMSGTRLKEFVYDTFPEITSMKWGEEIVL